MEKLEIEVKFFLPDIDLIRDRIIELGAENKGRVFETNIRFDDIENSLYHNQSLLRLRQDTSTTLTYKCEPFEKDDQFKTFKEFEVEVSDFTVMQRILDRIGFQPVQIYEKWRETFLYTTTLCIDTMPFGAFLEIEGPKERIRSNASAIGLDWDKRIVLNYLAIFDIIRHQLDLPYKDVTFDNFKNTQIDFEEYRDLVEVGDT